MSACNARNVETFFNGRPGSLHLFTVIQRFIESVGPVTIEFQKTQISFASRTKFAWVWLPQKWVNRPENSVTLSFRVRRHIEHPLIVEVFGPRYGWWMHHILIEEESDLEDAKSWLREAYTLCSGKML